MENIEKQREINKRTKNREKNFYIKIPHFRYTDFKNLYGPQN